MTTTIGQYLLDSLQEHGVNHIFGVPGDYVLRFDKLIEEHTIEYINATRENTAGYMADAYARIKGLGAACITYGVGINITNALAQAYTESSPVILISGAPGTDELLKSYRLHHLINQKSQLDIFKEVTVAQTVLDNPETAAAEIDRVLSLCLAYKKPVYIELPRNMVDKKIKTRKKEKPHPQSCNKTLLKQINHTLQDVLARSKKPVLWVGHEITRFSLSQEVLSFAEKYQIPIVSSLLGKTVISEYHPLFVGLYQGKMSRPDILKFVENCDCLIALGVLLSDMDTGIFTAKLNQEMQIIASEESLKINGQQHEISLSEIVQQLNRIKLSQAFAYKVPQRTLETYESKNKKITADAVFNIIQKHLDKNSVVVTDIGDCLFGGSELVLNQNSFFACSFFGTLGFAVPGAIGAQIAAPDKRVIGIVGDGAFQMTCTELSTAVRYGLDPIIILLNNQGYGTERPLLDGSYNDIVNWNYTALTTMLGGGIGVKIDTEKQFDKALETALSQRKTFYLIEVPIDKTDFSIPMQRFFNVVKTKIN